MILSWNVDRERKARTLSEWFCTCSTFVFGTRANTYCIYYILPADVVIQDTAFGQMPGPTMINRPSHSHIPSTHCQRNLNAFSRLRAFIRTRTHLNITWIPLKCSFVGRRRRRFFAILKYTKTVTMSTKYTFVAISHRISRAFHMLTLCCVKRCPKAKIE